MVLTGICILVGYLVGCITVGYQDIYRYLHFNGGFWKSGLGV